MVIRNYGLHGEMPMSIARPFAPPEEAKAATVLLGDLNRMDALFFRRRGRCSGPEKRRDKKRRQIKTAGRMCIPSPVIRTPRRAD